MVISERLGTRRLHGGLSIASSSRIIHRGNMDRNAFVLAIRQRVSELNEAMMRLREVNRVWTSQDFTTTLQQSELSGENETVTVADLTAGITSIQALDALLAAGHGTNLDKLIR
jgi:hypothetical protein